MLSEEAYTVQRRRNSAVEVCFGAVEYSLNIDMSDDEFEDEILKELRVVAIDHVCLTNVSLHRLQHTRNDSHA